MQYLLPGFITAWIFHGLTAHPKESQFERVIQALVFMGIVQALFSSLKACCFALGRVCVSLGEWSKQADATLPTIIAIMLGVGFSAAANSDWLFKALRKFKLTKKTGFPTVWYRAFYCNDAFAVFHLDGERRLQGWIDQYPSEPKDGYFEVSRPMWLMEDGTNPCPIEGVESILIRAEDVELVEFLKEKETADG